MSPSQNRIDYLYNVYIEPRFPVKDCIHPLSGDTGFYYQQSAALDLASYINLPFSIIAADSQHETLSSRMSPSRNSEAYHTYSASSRYRKSPPNLNAHSGAYNPQQSARLPPLSSVIAGPYSDSQHESLSSRMSPSRNSEAFTPSFQPAYWSSNNGHTTMADHPPFNYPFDHFEPRHQTQTPSYPGPLRQSPGIPTHQENMRRAPPISIPQPQDETWTRNEYINSSYPVAMVGGSGKQPGDEEEPKKRKRETQEEDRRKGRKFFQTTSITNSDYTTANPLHQILSKLTYLDITGQVNYDNSVLRAAGGYSDIFIGNHCSFPDKKVAVKRLRVHAHASDEDRFVTQLAKEMNIWSKLEHPNILQLLGYVLEGDYPCLISFWMDNGTVTRYISNHPECDLANMIINIAKGLEYLHTLDIIHSDIKADNVLISQDGEPLINDFGISRRLSSTHTALGMTTTGVRGSIRWMSPEILDMSNAESIHTKPSDVWAFGMLVYEILARKLPFYQLKHEVQVLKSIIDGNIPSYDATSALSSDLHRIWSICCDESSCWNKDVCRRPSMTNLIVLLTSTSADDAAEVPKNKTNRSTSADDEAELPKKKMSQRLRASCVECSRRQKCDRLTPCTLCKTREVAHLCKWAPEPYARPPPARPSGPGRAEAAVEEESESGLQSIPQIRKTGGTPQSIFLQGRHPSGSNPSWHNDHASSSPLLLHVPSARSLTISTQVDPIVGLREVFIAIAHMQLPNEDLHLLEGSLVCAIQELTDPKRLSSASLSSSRRMSSLIPHPSTPYNPRLPSQDHCATLLKGFLEHVNWSIGVPDSIILNVHDAMWEKIGPEQSGLVDFNPDWLSLLFAMLASSPMCKNEDESRGLFVQSIAAKKSEEDRLYPSLSTPIVIDSRGAAYSCLAASFIARYLQDRGQVKEAWRFISTGLRQAIDAGLHLLLEPRMLSDDERTLVLVTWHLCVEFDRFLSLFLGKPATIHTRDYNVQAPSPKLEALAMNGTTDTALLFQYYFISLLTTVSNAKERFLCSSPDLQENGHVYFDRSMGEWLRSLPAFYSLVHTPDRTFDGMYPTLHSQRLTLKAYYLSSCLLFHRSLAHARPEFHSSSGYGVSSYFDYSLLAQYAISILYSHSELLHHHWWERQIPFDISMHMLEAALTLGVTILRDMRNVNAPMWHRELARAIYLFEEMQAKDYGTIVKQALQMLRGLQELCGELAPKAIAYIPVAQSEASQSYSPEGYDSSFMPPHLRAFMLRR